MNDIQQKRNAVKQNLKVLAFISVLIAIICFALCVAVIHFDFSFLKPGANVVLDPMTTKNLVDMIREAVFWIIPGLSLMLLINAFIMWVASKNIQSNVE